MNIYKDLGLIVSRFLMAVLFFYAGCGKIYGYYDTAGYMREMGVPDFLLPFVIILELGGAIALILGLFTRLTAIVLGLFSVIAALIFHTNFSIMNNDLMLLKDLHIAGGFLILSITGAGKFSIDFYISKLRKKSR